MAYALADFTSRSILMSVRRGSGLGETVTMYRVYYVRLKRCVTGAHSRFFLLYGRTPKLHTILSAGIKKIGQSHLPDNRCNSATTLAAASGWPNNLAASDMLLRFFSSVIIVLI